MQFSTLLTRSGLRFAGLALGWSAALLAGLFWCYGPSLQGEFIWDDYRYIVENPAVRQWAPWWHLWTGLGDLGLYYPLSLTFFAWEHWVWGLDPSAFRVVHLLLHFGNAAWIALLGRHLKIPGAAWGAALFAVHPVQLQTVAWIVEGKNLLSAFLVFTAIWLYLRALASSAKIRRYQWLLATGMVYGLALLAKTSVCMLPFVFSILVGLKTPASGWKRWCPAHLLPFYATGLVAGLSLIWLELQGASALQMKIAQPLDLRSWAVVQALWFYLGQIACWQPFSFFYPRWGPPGLWAGSALALTLAVSFGLFRFRARVPALLWLAIGWWLVWLFPVLGFFSYSWLRYTEATDYYQYLASVAPCLGLAAWLFARWHRPTIPVVACVLLSSTFAFLTHHYAADYRNEPTLWSQTLSRNPLAWGAQANWGDYEARQGRFREARDHYLQALQLNPGDWESAAGAGHASVELDEKEKAGEFYRRALLLQPRHLPSAVNLSLLLFAQQRAEDGVQVLQQALQAQPRPEVVRYLLGLLKQMEPFQPHRQALLRAWREVKPGDPLLEEAWRNEPR
jgi:protein O-mannosyl-transferase